MTNKCYIIDTISAHVNYNYAGGYKIESNWDSVHINLTDAEKRATEIINNRDGNYDNPFFVTGLVIFEWHNPSAKRIPKLGQQGERNISGGGGAYERPVKLMERPIWGGHIRDTKVFIKKDFEEKDVRNFSSILRGECPGGYMLRQEKVEIEEIVSFDNDTLQTVYNKDYLLIEPCKWSSVPSHRVEKERWVKYL